MCPRKVSSAKSWKTRTLNIKIPRQNLSVWISLKNDDQDMVIDRQSVNEFNFDIFFTLWMMKFLKIGGILSISKFVMVGCKSFFTRNVSAARKEFFPVLKEATSIAFTMFSCSSWINREGTESMPFRLLCITTFF